ncbi:MAG: FAD-dependent oxidoreductase [Deltaproteobacteria bacterium]|nr:FAD-dependent oxidoreductase [Deltaproteobacteria bacterium]
MNQKTDILVIGGGAIGVCSAYYLSEQGRNVMIVEKGEICSGSSYGNAGMIVPSHSIPLAAPGVVSKGIRWLFNPESPFYIKPRFSLEFFSWLWKFHRACNRHHMHRSIPVIRDLNLASLQLFEKLATIDGLDFGFEKKGMLSIFNSKKGLDEGLEEARLMQASGLEARILSAQEIQELIPHSRVTAAGGVFYPQDACIIPQPFVTETARFIEKKGVQIQTFTEVLGFEITDGRITTVKTTRGDITAKEVVLAGGVWSPEIVRDLKIKLPIQPAKGYSITYHRPHRCPELPIAMAEAKVILTPMGDTMRFAGTLELAGFDLSINMRRVQAIINNVPKYLPEMHHDSLNLIEIWRGLRPCTPDGLPFIGRSPRYKNLIIAAGHAMIGISLSPITGKLVSQLAAHENTLIDLTPLRIDRFG